MLVKGKGPGGFGTGALSYLHQLIEERITGDPEPSDADRRITQRLKEALALVEIRVIDHVVVGSEGCVSFAERGLL